jgi:hypothetical protein
MSKNLCDWCGKNDEKCDCVECCKCVHYKACNDCKCDCHDDDDTLTDDAIICAECEEELNEDEQFKYKYCFLCKDCYDEKCVTDPENEKTEADQTTQPEK